MEPTAPTSPSQDAPAPATKPGYTCFVIMPFSDTRHTVADSEKTTSAAEWTNIYQEWIKRAVESYPDANIRCERSATAAGNFVKGIVGSLNDSDFVIADLTGDKSNVFYELGIRHALRTGTIIITQHRSALPSDLQTYYCLEYNYSGTHYEYRTHYTKFEGEIHGLVKSMIAQKFSSDSPVSDFLNFKKYESAKTWKRERDVFIAQITNFFEVESRFSSQIENFMVAVATNNAKPLYLDIFELELHLIKFATTDYSLLDERFHKIFQRLLLTHRRGAVQFNAFSQMPDGQSAVYGIATTLLRDWKDNVNEMKRIVADLERIDETNL